MKYRDNPAVRFVCFVLIPLLILIICAMNRGHYYSDLICLFGINTILAVSLNLVNGFSGMFSMGHAAFMAVGAYTSALLTISESQKGRMAGLPAWFQTFTLPFPLALLCAGAAAALLALLIGFPVLRLKNHYLSVATLGLIVIVRAFLDNEDQFTNGARGITGLPSYSNIVTVFVTALLLLYIMYRLIRCSSYGRGLIAMRDDDVADQTLGVRLVTKKISIFCLSAFAAGIGGALWGHLQSVISGQFFYFTDSFEIVEMSIIGGMFSLSGGIVGALVMTFLPEILAPLETGLVIGGVQLPELYGASNLILAVLLILLIIFRRQGILGYSEIIMESIFSKRTYTGLFQAQTYRDLAAATRAKLAGIGKGKQTRK